MRLISGVPEDPKDDTVFEENSADMLHWADKSFVYAIQTQDAEAQQNSVHWM